MSLERWIADMVEPEKTSAMIQDAEKGVRRTPPPAPRVTHEFLLDSFARVAALVREGQADEAIELLRCLTEKVSAGAQGLDS